MKVKLSLEQGCQVIIKEETINISEIEIKSQIALWR